MKMHVLGQINGKRRRVQKREIKESDHRVRVITMRGLIVSARNAHALRVRCTLRAVALAACSSYSNVP